jgi:UTP--glucose-1-phosphate uridylyltransferase
MTIDGLDGATADVLARYGFDRTQFESLRARVASGELSSASNVVAGPIEPPYDGDVVSLPEPGSREWEVAREAGARALQEGRLAQVVLAGGMATRFGGVVNWQGGAFSPGSSERRRGSRASSASTSRSP